MPSNNESIIFAAIRQCLENTDRYIRNSHAWAVRRNNPVLAASFFAAYRHPSFLAVGREEGLVRRPSDIGYVLYGVGRSIDESNEFEPIETTSTVRRSGETISSFYS